ncbi:Iron-sulfur cluster assembly accessory protein [Sphaerotilus natans subsp. natans DSM 6575]|uniref:Putative iron-sulfur cluster insertion protein ErpA n=2 Tax=Sphaerotilus natans TaxID=34103 RepID=A0A059KHH6_9BURK|nr:Iron-sulfur cluster assembly accessory protein [Sphaerotilus natans subsp. natans DSM 6575]SIR95964.1 iron-sulfur cluster insertion protein [Sphaerotilus natans]
MSACQSQGSSCSTPSMSAPPVMPVLPEGVDPIVVTDAVVGKVAEMLAEEGDPSLQLRVFVTGGGCSGFQYGFAFDDEKKADDVRVEKGPVTVVVDAMSLQYLMGAEIDFEDKLDGARFVIRNPNAASTCGCGSSFAV